jgi:excisionase family DNA binding protein
MKINNPFQLIVDRLTRIENQLRQLCILSNKEPKDENISVKEIAKSLNVTEQTVWSYIKKGLIPAKKIQRYYVIKRLDFENSIKEVKSLKYRRDV